MPKIKEYSLYLVITEKYAPGKSAKSIAELAILGGVDILQLREKEKPLNELLELGSTLSSLCKKNGVIFIVNDDAGLAKEVNADGVHVGQSDIAAQSIDEIRNILGKDKIIGISTHSLREFEQANGFDVDYISFGPIFAIKTKDYFIGTGHIKDVLKIAKKPVFFIGGINLLNIDELLALGVKNVALIRGILEAEDLKAASAAFKEKLKKAKERGKNDYKN
jgi:thiamine-phosphate pyrophosphorylase